MRMHSQSPRAVVPTAAALAPVDLASVWATSALVLDAANPVANPVSDINYSDLLIISGNGIDAGLTRPGLIAPVQPAPKGALRTAGWSEPLHWPSRQAAGNGEVSANPRGGKICFNDSDEQWYC